MSQDISRELTTDNGMQHAAAFPCCQFGHLSRRRFITAVGAWGATTTLPGGIALGQTTSNLIDTHRHFYPPDYQKAWLDWEDARKIPHFPAQVAWTRAKTIEEMDKNSIKTAVMSIASTPGVWFDAGPDAASRIVRSCND